MPTLGNYTFTMTGRQVLNRALLACQTNGLNFLTVAGSAQDKEDMAAMILTETERDLMLGNPGLGAGQATVTVAANTRDITVSTAIPSMFGTRIDRLYYSNSSSPWHMTPIRVTDRLEGENRYGWDTENYTQIVSDWAYFDRDRGLIRLQYKVPVETSFIVAYRQAGTTYTKATLDSATSAIPTQHIDALYYGVAGKFALFMGKPSIQQQMLEMQGVAQAKMTEAIADNLSDLISGQMDDEGFIQPLTRQHNGPPYRGFGYTY